MPRSAQRASVPPIAKASSSGCAKIASNDGAATSVIRAPRAVLRLAQEDLLKRRARWRNADEASADRMDERERRLDVALARDPHVDAAGRTARSKAAHLDR